MLAWVDGAHGGGVEAAEKVQQHVTAHGWGGQRSPQTEASVQEFIAK